MNRPSIHPAALGAAFLVGIIGISFSAIFVRWSEAPVSVIGMYRLLLTNLLMLPFLPRYIRELKQICLADALKLALSGVFLALHFLFWMASLRYTSVSSSTVILTLEPIFVLIGGYLLYRERTSSAGLIGMAAAMIGVVAMGWGDIGLSWRAFQGDLLSLLGAMAVAVHMLLGKDLRSRVSSFLYSFTVFLVAGAAFAGYNAVLGIRMTGYAPKEWGLFLLLAIVPTVFGHVLFNWMLRYVNTASVSMSVLGEPVGATLLAYAFLAEGIAPHQAAAGALIVIGVWFFLRQEMKQAGSRLAAEAASS